MFLEVFDINNNYVYIAPYQLMENVMTTIDRFKSRFIVLGNGCWKWTGSFFKNKEYGQFWWGTENGIEINKQAHRASYELLIGPIPEGKIICHKCNNGWCVNPEHLYAGTHHDNARDRDTAGHTSKWDHRYNFRRNQKLLDDIKSLRINGNKIEEICNQLNIGKTTYYRCMSLIDGIGIITSKARSNNLRIGIKKRHLEKPESICRGEKSGCSKITESDVVKIRQMRSSGCGLREIAIQFKLTEAGVSSICRRKTWKHVA